MDTKIEPERLRAHLEAIVGDRNALTKRKNLEQTADYISSKARDFGWLVTEQPVWWLFRRYKNLLFELPNSDKTAPLFIVGAHYDSPIGSPGADDNASAVAVLLELARIFGTNSQNFPQKLRLQLVAFTLEEMNMVGSAHYARQLRRQNANVAGMISLEMLGFATDAPNSQQLPKGYEHLYPSVGNFIGVIGNFHSKNLLDNVSHAMKTVQNLPVETLLVPENGKILPPVRLSDHAPFWDLGFEALLVTDTSWFRNPNYHQKSDTLDTLNLDFLARVGEGVAHALRKIG
jgi:aminopeptidase YwaD